MKKQWLSIVLVLCMVLCMAPTTALAAEGEMGTLKITVNVQGLYGGGLMQEARHLALRFSANTLLMAPIKKMWALPLSRAKQRAQWMCQSRQENIS